jgi:hypothetical protein
VARVSWKTILLTVAVTLGAALPAAGASTAAQAARTAGHGPAVPVFPGALGGVSASSPTDAWAVGAQCPQCNNSATLTLHWNGTHWSMVPSPNPGPKDNVLDAVAAVSSSYAWAVGSYGNDTCTTAATVILHWNGSAWLRVKSPDAGACNFLDGINAISAASAWAVGESCTFAVNHCHTLIVRWNGTAWSRVASPNPGADGRSLADVSADSASDAWAAGTYCPTNSCSTQDTLLLHWNGTAWTKVPSPNPGPTGNGLNGVAAVSPTNAWAVGSYCTTSSCAVQDSLLLHWNGTTWSKVPTPNPGPISNSLSDVTAVSPTDVWVAGSYCAPKCGGHVRTLILHWNGTAWTTVSSPDPGNINSLAAVTATASNNAWTVGTTCVTSVCNFNALILHWNGTAWTVSSG